MRIHNGFDMGPLALVKKQQSCNAIQDKPKRQNPDQAEKGFILDQTIKAVAEIEVSFERTLIVERPPAQVIDHCCRQDLYAVSGSLEAPAKVNLFGM